jgi:hypothetical protein
MPVEDIFQVLLRWSALDTPDGFRANPMGQDETDRRKMQSKMLLVMQWRANHDTEVCCMQGHWCSGSDITVVAMTKGKRILVLEDHKNGYDNLQTPDFLVTENDVVYLGDLDLGKRSMARGVDYDAIIIHERNHFVYAIPKPS